MSLSLSFELEFTSGPVGSEQHSESVGSRHPEEVASVKPKPQEKAGQSRASPVALRGRWDLCAKPMPVQPAKPAGR